MIHHGRMTADADGEFVVFLIGMRVNKWWKVHKWLPVFIAMPRMLRELSAHPDSGFMGSETSPVPTIIVQYWRSYKHLEAYARNRDQRHWPAWVAFNKRIANNGDVGIWHETYRIGPGQWETLYANMPSFGLGRATTVIPVAAHATTSRQRMEACNNPSNSV